MRVALLPWLHLGVDFNHAGVRLVRLERRNGRVCSVDPTFDSSELPDLDVVLEPFRRAGHGVDAATLMDISPANAAGAGEAPTIDDYFEIADLVAFAGLAARRLFENGGDGYCNSHCFQLVVQTLSSPPSKSVWAGSRRRDGMTRTLLSGESRWVHAPAHVGGHSRVGLDEALLGALLSARAVALGDGDAQVCWDRLRSAISQFNWANTDSDFIPQSAELIWVVGAFAQALGVDDAKLETPIAQRFTSIVDPPEALSAGNVARFTRNGEQLSDPVRRYWIRRLVQARHKPAHGAIQASSASDPWSWEEHLALAAVAFPLLIKRLLSEQPFKLYNLSDDDRERIDLFETLATINPFTDTGGRNVWATAAYERVLETASAKLRAALGGTELQ